MLLHPSQRVRYGENGYAGKAEYGLGASLSSVFFHKTAACAHVTAQVYVIDCKRQPAYTMRSSAVRRR